MATFKVLTATLLLQAGGSLAIAEIEKSFITSETGLRPDCTFVISYSKKSFFFFHSLIHMMGFLAESQ